MLWRAIELGLIINRTWIAQKGCFTAGHKPLFFDQEATVEQLAKGHFWDKSKHINALFEIDNPSQKGQKPPQKALKSGEKKNFHFGDFGVKKCGKVGILRKQDRQKKIG